MAPQSTKALGRSVRSRIKAAALLLAWVPWAALGQTAAVCHKGHADAGYKMTPMAPPPLRTGIGTTALEMTTKSPEALKYFKQGVALLHCFWDFEAYRSFKEAARIDPGAAMAYWGIVQSIADYKAMIEEKDAALEKIKTLLPSASEHEQYYLRALQKQQDDDGFEDYVSEMEALIDKYPEDVDAKLLLAINNPKGYNKDGRPNKGTIYSLMLLKSVLSEHPDSAAANHYLIHVLEVGPHADAALQAADMLGNLAPASGHVVHMPGHIYYKLGIQDRARQAFLASLKVDESYMKSEGVSTDDDWNYAHNLSYLIASDAEAGRYRDALDFASRLDKVPANRFLALGRPTHAFTIGSTTARLQLRFGNWQAVIDRPVDLGDDKVSGPAAIAFRDGVSAYARGMQALEGKRMDEASRQADALDALQWRLKSATDDAADDEDQGKPDRVFLLLDTASLDLRGSLRCAQGNLEEGYKLLKKAVEKERVVGYSEPPQYSRPELESLGYAYLRAGEWDKARDAFQSELGLRPRSGHALYGIAQSWEKAGKASEARKAYAEFLNEWKEADSDLPMMKHAHQMISMQSP